MAFRKIISVCALSGILLFCAVETLAGEQVSPDQISNAGSLIVPNLKPDDLRVFGNEKNASTIYVFSSLTCSHCAVFHRTVMPELLKEFVLTGKARLIYVDMPYDSQAITGTLYSRCIPPQEFESFIDKMFTHRTDLMYASKPRQMIAEFAGENDQNRQQIEDCVSNTALKKKIIEQRNNLSELYVVRATPTVVVVNRQRPKNFEGTDKAVILRDIHQFLEEK